MGLYELTVFVHIAAAVALLSSSVIASPGVRAAVQRARTAEELRAYLSLQRPLLVLEPVSAMAVLASGVYLASVAGFWTLGWVQVATVSWVVNAAVAGAVVKPAINRIAAAAAAAAGPVREDLDALRRSSRWSLGGDLLMASDASMLYLMTMKPDLAGSLLVVAVAFLAVPAAHLFRRPRRSLSGLA
jgi:hypothetical protein